jgi:quinol monooxygenase YgiN
MRTQTSISVPGAVRSQMARSSPLRSALTEANITSSVGKYVALRPNNVTVPIQTYCSVWRSREMGRYVVIADFQVKPGRLEEFVEIAKVDAAASVANEPGCQRFDVNTPHDGSDRVNLHEIYENESAFNTHLETPHLKAFREGIAALVADRNIIPCHVTENSDG